MQRIDSKRIYEGRVINLRVDTMRTPHGDHAYEVVEHRGAVVVIVQPTPHTMVLVRQYRVPLAAYTWEACAGGIDGDETPRDAAFRELREETGIRAQAMTALWSAYSAPGFCDELLHFFVTSGGEMGATDFDAGEDIEIRTFALEECERMLHAGEIRDAKTQIAILWALSART